MYDILVKNGRIMDGSGNASYLADVAVSGGKIAKIAPNIEDEAARVINAGGMAVTPGFIDSHSHADASILDHLDASNLVLQGITSVMSGQCGTSAAPTTNKDCDHPEKRTSVKVFYDYLDSHGMGINLAMFVGHGTIRNSVMGELANRAPTRDEMERMKDIIRRSMDEGALGLNSGTYYTPCAYATTDELVELCSAVKEKGGVFAAHIRSESVRLIESVAEMIEIARRSGVPTVISHHKAAGGPNYWGLSKTTLSMIAAARAEGVPIWLDVYPYNACSTSLWSTYISAPTQALGKAKITEMLKTPEFRAETRAWIEKTFITYSWKEKGLSWAMLAGLDAYKEYNGLRISEAAKLHGKDEFETLFDILVANKMGGLAVLFTMNEDDVRRIIATPYAMIGTDAGTGKGAHPRYFGSFPRALRKYVREEKLDTWENMIHRITAMPAALYGFKTKGRLAEGYDADICIFDTDTIAETSTFVETEKPNVGLAYVIINGVIAAENGVCTNALSGRTIRRSV